MAPTNLSARGANLLNNSGFEAGEFTNWTAYGADFNTMIENIRDVPVHDPTNVLKLLGRFNAGLSRNGLNLSLSFPTFLGLAYQVRFNNDLGDATWLVLTNTIGDGATKLVSDVVVATRRFYQVACVCN